MARKQPFPNRVNGCYTSQWLIFEHFEKNYRGMMGQIHNA